MRLYRLMSSILCCMSLAMFSFGIPVDAAVPHESTTIAVEKPVQFEDPEGEDILVPSGTYSVKAGTEQLALTPKDSTEAINIAAKEDSHKAEFTSPAVAWIDLQEDEGDKVHLLLLFLPSGQSLQAVGTEAPIRSRGIPDATDADEELPDPATVSFEKAVYFIAPDGSPVVVPPGTYSAEAAQEWIRLIPGHDRQNAILIEAQKGTHDTENADLLALSLPGSTTEELDLHRIMLLLPNGQSLNATGSYSGIQPRGFFKKAFNKAKRTAKRHYKKAKKTTRKATRSVGGELKKGWSQTKQAAAKTKRGIEKGAKQAWQGAKWVAQQGAIGTCKATFWTMKTTAQVEAATLGKARAWLMNQLKTEKFQRELTKKIEGLMRSEDQVIQALINAARVLGDPRNSREVKDLTNPNKLCERPGNTIEQAIFKMAGPPIKAARSAAADSQSNRRVRSRGLNFPAFTIGAQLAGTKGWGGEFGAGWGCCGRGKGPYLFMGGLLSTDFVAAGVTPVQVGIWFKENLKDVGGGYLGVGFTKSYVKDGMSFGLDFFFNLSKKDFLKNPLQGIVVNPLTLGASKLSLSEKGSASAQFGGTWIIKP